MPYLCFAGVTLKNAVRVRRAALLNVSGERDLVGDLPGYRESDFFFGELDSIVVLSRRYCSNAKSIRGSWDFENELDLPLFASRKGGRHITPRTARQLTDAAG